MGATAKLNPATLHVQPGGEARCAVTVRNTSHVVEEMTFQVLGPTAAYARLEPDRLSLFPGTEGVTTLVFAPPHGADVAAGKYDFALKVNPREDAEGSCVEEGTLEVAAFSDSLLELVPRTSKGRASGKHEWALDNRGNAEMSAKMRGANSDGLLLFEFDPSALDSPQGMATFGKLKVKPKKRFWRGPPKAIPFEVFADIPDQPTLRADGIYMQEAVLPKWLLRLLALLAALALLLAVLYMTLLKPQINSAAKAAVKKDAQIQALQDVVDAAGLTDPTTKGPSGNVAVDPNTGTPKGGPPPTAEGKSAEELAAEAAAKKAAADAAAADAAADGADELLGGGRRGKSRFFNRFAPVVKASDAPNRATVTVEVKEDEALDLTDIVFQNPNGDSGFLRVLISDNLLIEVNLDNVRDLDYHFVTGTPIPPKNTVQVQVECKRTDDQACSAAAYITGTLVKVKPPAPPTPN